MEIVVRQISGLGNQLFQYAAGRYYAKRYQASLRMALDPPKNAHSHGSPRPFLLSQFCIGTPMIPLSAWDRFLLSSKPLLMATAAPLKRALGIKVFQETPAQRYRFLEDLQIPKSVRTLYLVGYWQTYRLVQEVEAELRVDLQFKHLPFGRTLEVLHQIRACACAVSLHIRRGDYTLAAEGNIALPLDYYSRAIQSVRERFSDPVFFVFSDDIAFAHANLPSGLRMVFVDHNDHVSSHEDLRLMSACHHHILANSTFSWWGCWLNPRADKMVIAPKHWLLKSGSYYPDLLPPDWTLIVSKE